MIGRSMAHIGQNRQEEIYGQMPFPPTTHQMMSAVVGLTDPVLCHSQDIKGFSTLKIRAL